MKDYAAKDIRNVALLGHSGSGKSAFVEAALFTTKAIDRMGKTVDGTSTMDYDPEETKRGLSVYSALAPIEWKNTKINFVDTPGYLDYEGEKVAGFSAGDAALVVVSAKEGVESGTENAVKMASKAKVPCFFFINKIDDDNADFDKTVAQLQETFGSSVVPFETPTMNGHDMTGTTNVFDDKSSPYYDQIIEAIASADESLMDKFFEGEEFTPEELTKGLKAALKSGELKPVFVGSATANKGVEQVLDFIKTSIPAFIDLGEVDALTEKGEPIKVKTDAGEPFSARVFKTVVNKFGRISYFKVMSGTLTPDTPIYNSKKGQNEKLSQFFILKGKNQITVNKLEAGDIGCASKLQDTDTNDTLCNPSKKVVFPDIVFPRPMLGVAISPASKDDESKMSDSLRNILDEDKSLILEKNAETGQQILYAVGDQQIELVASKLKNDYKVEIKREEPKIQYRETIRKTVEKQGKHKKQTGGAGQYGDVWIRFEPCDSEEMIFETDIFGGSVPRQFWPPTEAGLRDCMEHGILADCKVVGVKCTLFDGSTHPVDSKEVAFKAAAKLAFRAAMPEAGPVLLEPIGKATVICPEKYTGDIIGDFNKRRGMIMNIGTSEDGEGKIEAEVPMAEMQKYATELRSMTQGRGSYVIEFDRYEPAPQNVTDKVVAATAALKKAEEED